MNEYAARVKFDRVESPSNVPFSFNRNYTVAAESMAEAMAIVEIAADLEDTRLKSLNKDGITTYAWKIVFVKEDSRLGKYIGADFRKLKS